MNILTETNIENWSSGIYHDISGTGIDSMYGGRGTSKGPGTLPSFQRDSQRFHVTKPEFLSHAITLAGLTSEGAGPPV